MNPKELLKHASKAQNFAKAQYSNFPVGAAILCKNNKIILGCNIESKAYPSTMCAERVAIYSAISQGISHFNDLIKGSLLRVSNKTNPFVGCRIVFALDTFV